ncbi:S8 family peptidase [Cellulophaga tyrosinoxydans]|uniref:Subtilase family protein n=1 Tax=Cellulophaga tyrosinoxydans TaxID=504486 RepID=A0A1W1YV61_9FLAO|nr:S8 family peptidase [Cellulophaga tyrosinoxydans]SMC39608.1 Subtilase family protein [Cellulophaga tyrosinoxydans]
MTFNFSKPLIGLAVSSLLLAGCGATAPVLVSTPVENIDTLPLKVSQLSETEKQTWGHKDLFLDTIPGMAVEKAYTELIKNKKGDKVIVAVLDSGMDLKHEDLVNVLWTNTKEIPGNNKDDDNNGYVDDIHGYNFLGESYNEQLEAARVLKLKLGDAAMQAKAKAKIDADTQKYMGYKSQLDQMYPVVQSAHEAISKHLGKSDYTKKEVAAIKTEDQTLLQSQSIIGQMFQYGDSITEVLESLKDDITQITEMLNYNLNIDFDGRKPVGDNPYDITDTKYGNGNPQNRVDTESHGTHVAGIIGAQRGNGKGVDGVANNVALMSIRAVPNGDEYDKDIALGIRYAVDNGAKIINASFGKAFSPNAQWVYDALKYAASKDVLFVHAAGNDSENLDDPNNPNFPNDQVNNGAEFTDNVLTVGSLTSKYGSQMVSSFSNYGTINVDVFAPGSEIYSTVPNSKYEYMGGTSMAAPGVAGIAALIRSQYPKLTAVEVKKIIMQSGITTKAKVVVGEDSKSTDFNKLSTSGKMANAYNALILADQVATGKAKL